MIELAMFPLGTTLMPGSLLPLRIFEDRFKTMLSDCLAQESPQFGSVLIPFGSEVGGGEQRSNIGTIARIMRVVNLDDGSSAIICGGTRRFRVVQWLDDHPYPRANVSLWPDQDGSATTHDIQAITDRVRRVLAMASELGDSVAPFGTRITGDSSFRSFQLAGMTPVVASDHYKLLSVPSTQDRLVLLAEMLSDIEVLQQFRLDSESDVQQDDL